MTPYVYEFLYRGADPDEAVTSPAWHVIMRGLSGETWPGERVFNMQQAAEAGFDLPAVIGGINAAALAEVDHLNSILATLQGEDA
ncbi:MAG: hypothetical protein WDN06_19805 [Asticcacaulis sp.]